MKKPTIKDLGSYTDGGDRTIPHQWNNVHFSGDAQDGIDACAQMAMDNNDNIFGLQDGQGGQGGGWAQCFTGKNPNYARKGANSSGPVGRGWVNRVYSIVPTPIALPQNPTLSQGNRIAVIMDTTGNYVLSFDITPHGKQGGWSNIIRFTYTDNNDCCNFGDRSPAIWFHPGATGLHVRIGDANDGNWGIDTDQLPLNVSSHVVVTCINNSPSVTVTNVGSYTANQPSRRATADGRPLIVYASDRFYPTANATITNLLYQIV